MTTIKELRKKIIAFLEDFIDINAVKAADFGKGKDFEKVVKKLNI